MNADIISTLKSPSVNQLVNDALFILRSFGIPFESLTKRRLEKMAMAFLAVLNVKAQNEWKIAKCRGEGWSPQTRQIIEFINKHFEENISMGSYDDIRRKDLKLPTTAGIIEKSANDPSAARNCPTRGYALNPFYVEVVRKYGSLDWENLAFNLASETTTLKEALSQYRNIEKVSVSFPDGKLLNLSPGKHNELQKAIVQEFLPRFGHESEVLYLGDASDKYLLLNKKKLEELSFFELKHGELPDVVAFTKKENWIFLIEAVHTSGPISSIRMIELKKLTESCTADIIYVTAFIDKSTFRRFAPDIAWETEVWIANTPDHLIHFNGNKFLGPYTI